MKKIILTILMFSFILVGCTSQTANDNSATPVATNQNAAVTAAPSVNSNGNPGSSVQPTATQQRQPSQTASVQAIADCPNFSDLPLTTKKEGYALGYVDITKYHVNGDDQKAQGWSLMDGYTKAPFRAYCRSGNNPGENGNKYYCGDIQPVGLTMAHYLVGQSQDASGKIGGKKAILIVYDSATNAYDSTVCSDQNANPYAAPLN